MAQYMTDHDPHTIPPQQEGAQTDISERLRGATIEEARHFFVRARERLFNVSHWSDISEGISASFVLTDQYGQPKQGRPQPGDHFRIDIPGPGTAAGEGYDWVKVELVEDNTAPENETESAVIKVRPSEDPGKQEGVAHFFEPGATSSFIVKRENTTVSAEVHGRNEKPNTETKSLAGKVRNAVIGAAAAAGFANIQWQKLVKGLLDIR
jgi:hypothetical protein